MPAGAAAFRLVAFIRSGTDAHQAHQVTDAGTEDGEVDDDEQHERQAELICAVARYRIGCAQYAIDSPWLPPDLGRVPAGENGDQASWTHQHRATQEKAVAPQAAAPIQEHADDAEQDHANAQADHDAEGPEDD